MQKEETVVHNPGLKDSITILFRSLSGLAVSRLELAKLELSEVRKHVIEIAVLFGAAVFTVWFAIAYGTMTIVALAWEEMGWTILLLMFVVFAVITGILVGKGMALIKNSKLSLPATMKELKNDRDALF
jgi:uncharacterized membrane protein YqjE